MTEHTTAEIVAWFTGRLPDDWTKAGTPTITVDRDEIVVTLDIGTVALDDGADEAAQTQAAEGHASKFREGTREERITVAAEAEHRFERKVSWAVTSGGQTMLFTHLAVPTMTRLRQPQRQVLDTLVAAGVARSRSDALGWCVTLVGRHTEDWLTQLRGALADVDRIRATGPEV